MRTHGKSSTGAGSRPFLMLDVFVRNVCPLKPGLGTSREFAFNEIAGFSAASANHDDLAFQALPGMRIEAQYLFVFLNHSSRACLRLHVFAPPT